MSLVTSKEADMSVPRTDSSSAGDNAPVFEIRPSRGWVAINFGELFHYRELLYFLAWRDVKVRYKQTVLGFAWAILQPLFAMVMSTFIFGGILGQADKLPRELLDRHIPYALYVYAGLLPWLFFQAGLSGGGMSLVNQQNMLTKIYFPRLFIPSSVIGAAFVDAVISFALFMGMMALWHVHIGWEIALMPALVLLTVFMTMGITFFLAALTVTYRDFRFLVPFLLNMWQFISPVYYPLNLHKWWEIWIMRLNPLYGLLGAFRSALLGQKWNLPDLGISVAEITIMMVVGLYYFKRTERRFADIA